MANDPRTVMLKKQIESLIGQQNQMVLNAYQTLMTFQEAKRTWKRQKRAFRGQLDAAQNSVEEVNRAIGNLQAELDVLEAQIAQEKLQRELEEAKRAKTEPVPLPTKTESPERTEPVLVENPQPTPRWRPAVSDGSTR